MTMTTVGNQSDPMSEINAENMRTELMRNYIKIQAIEVFTEQGVGDKGYYVVCYQAVKA